MTQAFGPVAKRTAGSGPKVGLEPRDTLFRDDNHGLSEFHFGNAVARVFDDMVNRSVPFYEELQRMAVELTGTFARTNTVIYDLGCSTGATLVRLAQAWPSLDVEFVGVDNSDAMLEQARHKLASAGCLDKCSLIRADLGDLRVENASVILMILTMQFVQPARRKALIRRLAAGLVTGGALILVEKTVSADPGVNRLFIDHYHDFKMRQGYSQLEVARKRDALDNVLIPHTLEKNIQLLASNGFSTVQEFFRWYNFSGILAVKRNTGAGQRSRRQAGGE